MAGLAALYFPTTTIFIDDDISFLDRLTAAIDDDRYMICQDFEAVVAYAKHTPQIQNIRDINTLVQNPKKHELVSTIVIDYQMEPVNGLDLCKMIKNSPVSKILLTGTASKDKAIAAHNADLIDCFISKQDPQFLEKLNEAISAGKRKYFERLSKRISGFYNSDNPLINPICAAYFKKELLNTVSYYSWLDFNRLKTTTSSNISLDYMLCSEDDYTALLDSEEANEAPVDVIQKLNNRTSMLWFEQTIPPGNEWAKHLRDCSKISGSTFYISKNRF